MQSPPELINSACEALAVFLDRNASSVRSALHFPIIHSLLPLLLSMKGMNDRIGGCNGLSSEALIFCLCKILAYEPIGREQIFERTPDFFMSIVFPLYPLQPGGAAKIRMHQQMQQQMMQQQMNQQQKLLMQQMQQQQQQQQTTKQQQILMQQQLMMKQQMLQQQSQQVPIQQQQQQAMKQQVPQQQISQQQQQQLLLQQQMMKQQLLQQQQQNSQSSNQPQIPQQQPQQQQQQQAMMKQLPQQQQMMQQQLSQQQMQQLYQQQLLQMQQQQQLIQAQQQQQQQQVQVQVQAPTTAADKQPLPSNESATLPLILTVLFVRNSPKILSAFVASPWTSFVVPLLKDKSVDARIWSLLLISIAVKGIKDDRLLTSLFKEVTSLSEETSTDIRVALVYCLTQFIVDYRAPYQGEILTFILSNRSQPCFLIRCQVLSALSYYYQKFPEKFLAVNSTAAANENDNDNDSENDSETALDILAHDSLIELSCDAHPVVAETAASIISSITNGDTDKIAKPSNLLDSFCSLILQPIGHILTFNRKSRSIDRPMSSFACTTRPKVAPPAYYNIGGVGGGQSSFLSQGKFRKIQNMLKIGPIYTHNTAVTSNFVYLPPKQLLFGDKEGVINIKNWNDGKVTQSHKISENELVCMKYVENSSYPLLFASTTRGSCLCHSFAYKEPIKLLSAFQLHSTRPDPCHFFDVDTVYGRLFSYEPHYSSNLTLFDLRSEIEKPDVTFEGKTICSFHCVNQGTSIVAVCTDDRVFNLVDVRIKETVISVNLSNRPFDFRVVDPTDPSFAVLLEGGAVEFFDLKNIEGTRRSSRMLSVPPIDVASFDVSTDMLCGAIGHSNGLSLVDLMNQKITPFNSFQGWFGGGQTFDHISRTLFSPQGLSLSILNGQSEIAVLLEGKESE